jgi:hypothetical protein
MEELIAELTNRIEILEQFCIKQVEINKQLKDMLNSNSTIR